MNDIRQRGDGGGVHMSLGGHLDELRTRLGWALGGFAIAFFASLAAGKWFAGVILSPYRMAMEAAGLEVAERVAGFAALAGAAFAGAAFGATGFAGAAFVSSPEGDLPRMNAT